MLRGQKTGELLTVACDGVSEGNDGFPTLLNRSFGPGLKGHSGGGYGIVNIFLRRDWYFGIGLGGGRIDIMAGLRCGSQFVVDDIVESLSSCQLRTRCFSLFQNTCREVQLSSITIDAVGGSIGNGNGRHDARRIEDNERN